MNANEAVHIINRLCETYTSRQLNFKAILFAGLVDMAVFWEAHFGFTMAALF